ncbi:MAG TPA: restriction endonuclease subunit S [Terriglobia bacterium]|nr:restriction endonuclease subunit S [Terriglobia bacterium]
MKNAWEFKDLTAVSDINYGYTQSASNERVGPRFLRITDIQNDHVDWESVPYCKIESADIPKYRLASGDIVFARTGATTGKSFLVNDTPDAVFASYLIRLRLLDKKLLHKFVWLFFQTDRYWKSIKDGSTGSAQGGFNATKLGSLTIPIPPRAEQQRIVGILDEAFDGIATAKANAEKNLQNARALFESHLNSVFTQRGPGWEQIRLRELSKITYGYTESASAEEIGPRFLRITDIQNNHVDWETVPYCSIVATDYPKYKLASGDIVFARTGATTGKSYLVTDPPEAVFASYLIRLHLSARNLLPEFVNLFFQTRAYWDTIRSGVSGSAQGGFNATKLGELVIPFPKSAKDQLNIVAKLAALSAETQRLESIYQQKLAALEELKKSLLHQAFSGAL